MITNGWRSKQIHRTGRGATVHMIKKSLINIWDSRPTATDAVEEIANDWLGVNDMTKVKAALDELCEEGICKRYPSGRSEFYYAVRGARVR